jgi:ParB-like nuclease domain
MQWTRLRSRRPQSFVQLSSIRPCPDNNVVYGVQSLDDPDIVTLIESIRAKGIMDPIHISADNVIISGHRRWFCALQVGLREVPAIRNEISYREDRDALLNLLVEANTQRKKTAAMLVHEAAIKINPKEAVQALRTERKERDAELLFGRSDDTVMEASGSAKRKKISEGSMPFLRAALDVANGNRDYWPLSVRQIHYRLLNDPPLKFTLKGKSASKKDRRYANDESSYKALVNLLARARVEGRFPWAAIEDETRPEELNNHFWNPSAFFKDQFSRLLKGYRRNRQQSQHDHIEIVAEKLTVRSILDPIASEHSIPLTVSRGHCGPTLKRKIVQRFKQSRKGKLILLCVTDLQNFKDDFADDFGLDDDRVVVIRAGLSMDRVKSLGLIPSYDTEEKDISTKRAYEEKYGTTDAYELEAMEPADLQDALTEDIDSVMDLDAYNAELEQEDKDAVDIMAMRDKTARFFKDWRAAE